jgi:hypothetical protein
VAAITASGYAADDMLPTAGGTMTGNLSLQGTPYPVTIPEGAENGYVLTSDPNGNGSWQEAPGAGGGFANPMTTAGDLIDGGASGTPQRLAIGSTGQVLTVSSGAPAWETLPAATTGAEGTVQLAGDLGGTATTPEVLKIQGTAIGAPPGGTTEFLAGNGTWQTPSGSGAGLGGVTLSGTPVEGQAIVATSSSAAKWQGLFGTRPEMFGTINGTSDGALINDAISAINSGSAPGPLVLTGVYNIEQPIVVQVGVNIWGTGQGNRQNTPNTFTGAFIRPSSSFSGSSLITIGSTASTLSAAAANPCGTVLFGICLSGITSGGTSVTSTPGILITDTADVHLQQCFIANFDRSGGTGYGVSVYSGTSGYGFGFQMQESQVSNCAYGVSINGAGATDARLSANLLHSNTFGLTVGASAGGGGLQCANNHYVYSGGPSSSYHLSMGGGAGGATFVGEYFDKSGSASTNVPVQLATSKVVMNSCHFLAQTATAAASLVSCSAANQELSFTGNHMDGNGSAVTALVQFTNGGISTTLNGGAYSANVIYNAPSATAVLIGSGGSAITTVSPTATVTGGVICDPTGA